MDSSDTLIEEKKLMSEAKYRNYMSNIDKALRNFEYSSEWADLISALGKLNKAISSNAQYQIIPRRIKISKRLAQCMHPALPSGVHLKALETYDVIFSKTGPERLATELFIYSAGLFPLLSYAAMNVRPALLGIYEKYFVPLGEKLRPALSGFLSGVFPGYESGLDHFDRTNSLLTQVCAAVGPMYFYSVLWECVTTNASIRLPAISYLLDHYNKRLGMREQIYIMGYNHDIMMSGLCACLNDSLILVQRNTLEFLLLGFPMHTNYLNHEDIIKLVTYGLSTILRRDMSLNRRLYSWLLGTEVLKMSSNIADFEHLLSNDSKSSDNGGNNDNNRNDMNNENNVEPKSPVLTSSVYFERYSKEILIKALTTILQNSLESTPVDLKPYRILVSLLDKAEIGLAVLDYVLCDVIRTMSLSNDNLEVGKSANLLFATFDPAYIWNFMTMMYEKNCKISELERNQQQQQKTSKLSKNLRSNQATATKVTQSISNERIKSKCIVGSGDPDLIEVCYLTEFLLETISLEMYNETTRVYLPKIFLAITRMLTIHHHHLSNEEVSASLKLCMKIVSRVQPMTTSPVKTLSGEKRSSVLTAVSTTAAAATTTLTTSTTTITTTSSLMMSVNKDDHNKNFGVSDTCNALEKSKSDSKLNQFSFDDEPMRRSNSNYNIDKRSPKKSKKAKSYSKLLIELDKELHPDSAQQNQSEKIKNKKITPNLSGLLASSIKFQSNSKEIVNQQQEVVPNIHLEDDNNLRIEITNTDSNLSITAPTSQLSSTVSPNIKQEGLNCNVIHHKNNIIEKCIKQYEIFYEVYLARKILEINTTEDNVNQQEQQLTIKCPVKVKVDEMQSPTLASLTSVNSPKLNTNENNVFNNEIIYYGNSEKRLIEINKLFETLKINSINRTKHLQNLLKKSINHIDGGSDSDVGNTKNKLHTINRKCDSTSDLSTSDTEFKDCVSDVEKFDSPATIVNEADKFGYNMDCSSNYYSGKSYYSMKIQKFEETTEQIINKIMHLKLDEVQLNSIKLASNLLVEMSTFSNYNKDLIIDHNELELPSWLKVLTITACYTQNDSELQLTTILTLFDLISLLRSQVQHTTNPGVTFVVMLPLLRFGHVYYLENKTRVFHLLISILWDYLDETKNVDLSQITSLLYQLHNCLDSGLVESVISNRMSNAHTQFIDNELIKSFSTQQNQQFDSHQKHLSFTKTNNSNSEVKLLTNYKLDRLTEMRMMCVPPTQIDLEKYLNESESKSFKKFELLWHLGRDKNQTIVKSFERTLLRVFDILSLPQNLSIRTFVTKWLQESLLRGDLSRLIKPLLNKILLVSNTKRISIIHVHLLKHTDNNDNQTDVAGCRDGADDDHDTDVIIDREVYAISSEYGNVKYHMDPSMKQKRSPIRSLQKKFFGVTLGNKNKTSNFVSDKTLTPATTPVSMSIGSDNMNSNNIGLIVNPLDLSSDVEHGDTEMDSINSFSAAPITANEISTLVNNKTENTEPVISPQSSSLIKDISKSANEISTDIVTAGTTPAVEYCSSSDDSDDSYTETESEQRETSIEKEVTTSGGTGSDIGLKRFVGDCDHVSETLSQHDRAKNRKTYHLNQNTLSSSSSLQMILSNNNNNNSSVITEEQVHTAEEYFSTSSDSKNIENFVNDVLNQASLKCDRKSLTPEIDNNSQSEKTITDKKSTIKKRNSLTKNDNNKKRSSCNSKISIESTNTTISITCDQSLNNTEITSDDEDNDDPVDVDDEDDIEIGDTDENNGNSNSDNENDVFSNSEDQQNQQITKLRDDDDDDNDLNNSLPILATEKSDFIASCDALKRRSSSLTTAASMNLTTVTITTTSTVNKGNWELNKETLEKSKQNVEILRKNVASDAHGKKIFKKKRYYERVHPYHTHILLYYDVYDTKQTLYAFQTLRNIIASDTRTFLCLSITTSISNGSSLKNLLIRHKKSIFGKEFNGNIINTEFSQQYRGCMYLEALVQICLYYGRSYFQCETSKSSNDVVTSGTTARNRPIKSSEKPTFEDICGNCKVQLASFELLTLICTELIEIVKDMGKGLACYIADLMAKCKMQKIILHCINSSVISFNTIPKLNATLYKNDELNLSSLFTTNFTMSEQILAFNYPKDENLHAESFQIQLLRLLMAVIKLEYEVNLLKNDDATSQVSTGTTTSGGGSSTTAVAITSSSSSKIDTNLSNCNTNSPTRFSNAAAINVKYLPNCLISQQPMFLASVLNALQADHLRHLHRNWTDLVTSSLNCFNFGSLTNIVISIVHQLCNNLDKISKLSLKEQSNFPPDYVVSQLEAITILCHYCLLDNTQQTTLSHLFNQAYPQTSCAAQSSNTGQILNNIVHSFLSSNQNTNQENQNRNAQHLAARNAVLSHLSRIVATVAAIWDSELGQVRQVKQQLMEFLSPISLHHGVNFLAAVAVTWQERGEIFKKEQQEQIKNEMVSRKSSFSENFIKTAIPQASPEQQSLVKLVSSIRVMPMDSFVQTLHQVVKSPPPIHRPPVGLTIEVSALELFYFYMRSAPAPQIGDCWSSLLALLRDGLNLSPPAQFVLLMLLNEFVQKYPQLPFPDKKDLRDLHDVTSRLVETLSNVAGACLEQTTWLRRNLAVKEDIVPTTPDGNIKDLTGNQQYCVQAQLILASVLANLLDVAYGSQEKDKVVAIVTTLLYNITPYLKNHTVRNIPSFYACSYLLANLSGYQYTRKAWRKDMFDLFLDPAFFQMDISCLPFWKQILDNLMTYDNTTFRELMSRVSLAQSSGLSIFSSREQEYEQRAILLKRLAFVIFCSELDQYHKYMPEIQEQLVNSLRLPSVVPSIQAAVFLCFRVLLLRMSPDHVTSLWPIIIAEMVQIFLAMEQELKSDNDEFSQQFRILSGLEVNWASSSDLSSQLHLSNWRMVQLEAAKLLELGCVLPATLLPHFQMYRWAFVGTEFDTPENNMLANGIQHLDELQLFFGAGYVPHVRRIARLMDLKYAVHSPKNEFKKGNHLVLTCQQISSLQDLYGFFSTLSVTYAQSRTFADTDKTIKSCLDEIEDVLSSDFLERMQQTSITSR